MARVLQEVDSSIRWAVSDRVRPSLTADPRPQHVSSRWSPSHPPCLTPGHQVWMQVLRRPMTAGLVESDGARVSDDSAPWTPPPMSPQIEARDLHPACPGASHPACSSFRL